jgi:hypothetical protein
MKSGKMSRNFGRIILPPFGIQILRIEFKVKKSQ